MKKSLLPILLVELVILSCTNKGSNSTEIYTLPPNEKGEQVSGIEIKYPWIKKEGIYLRSFPSSTIGSNLLLLKRNQRVFVKRRVEKASSRGNSVWYEVGFRNEGKSVFTNGWVESNSIEFNSGYDEQYWNIETVPYEMVYRYYISEQIVKQYLGDDDQGMYKLDLLDDYSIIAEGATYLWYLKDVGFTKANTYYKNGIEIVAFVNEETQLWQLFSISYDNDEAIDYRFIGIDASQLPDVLGIDNSIEGDIISYEFDPRYGPYQLSAETNEGKVTKITLERYYD